MGKEDNKNKFGLIINRSYIYLLPMIGLNARMVKSEFLGLNGVFIKNEDFPELIERIYVRVKFSKERLFGLFEEKLKNIPCFDFSYEPDKYHTMYVFNVPAEYKHEYDRFMGSKYSQLSAQYKEALCKFHGYTKSNAKTVLGILYRWPEQYEKWEAEINKDIPEEHWITIPRDQEIGTLLEVVIKDETFKQDDKIKDNMYPNESVI